MSLLSELNRQILSCQDCSLSKGRTNVVPGEGADNADIIFVGEAPGWHEDQQGRPFVGPAGHYLDDLLKSINLKRSNVFIANIIKCRPPSNRDPLPAEIQACKKWLDQQLDLIRPKVIVTLGRYSLSRFFPGEVISKVHGTVRTGNGTVYFAMYHPAAALHQQSLKKIIEADMLKLPRILQELGTIQEKKEEVKQLNLF
ncbi:MAG: uracil-DNA glycosylase [Dehalococcoidia bacterium]|nr:uracil-DNA glycosylase [Dehalococcoidia bacterium]MDZ4247028.1 uracil-DNA glycosylase [Dehalococcoidia bacterium]